MRLHPRASTSARSHLLALCAAVLLAACSESSLPLDRPSPTPFRPTQVRSQPQLAQARGFADQAGGGVFATASGGIVRLRLDGSTAALEPHPGNRASAGPVQGVFRLGPHSALVDAQGGMFLADSGWLIAPPWRDALEPGVLGTAQSGDGTAWVAHASGLFRLHDGALSELKAGGESLRGISAIASAPAADGAPGVWVLHEGRVLVVVAASASTYQVREATVPLAEAEEVLSLAGLGPGAGAPGELWLLTNQGLLHRAKDGWRRVELAQQAEELLAAGRFLWVKAGDSLLLYDADSSAWGEVSEVDTAGALFLAADEAGAVWVRLGNESVALSRAPVPRVRGLYQGMQVVEDGLVVRAVPPPGQAPQRIVFELGGTEVTASGPDYSLGGAEADGTLKAYSFAGLPAGRHALSVVARFADGTEARRLVPFEYQPLSTAAVGWDADIRPIHEARCAKCHTTSPGRPLNTYELWKENAALITAAVREKRMPADGPLDPQLISVIQRWAASGANP